MSFYNTIILLAALLFFSFITGAQDNNYVYQDTTILKAGSVGAKAVEIAPVQDDKYENHNEHKADTILRKNQLFVDSDSIKGLKNSKSFAYAKNLDSLLREYQKNLQIKEALVNREVSLLDRFFLSPVTKYFFWILGGFFVSFILYKLFFTEGFFQWPNAKTKVTLLPEERETLSKTADYEKQITQAIGNGNYRAAVRYHYLLTLQKLYSKGAIQWASDKTNHQYLDELSGKAYQKAFALLTLNYEYVWYGEFEIDENVFHVIQNKFKQFYSEV